MRPPARRRTAPRRPPAPMPPLRPRSTKAPRPARPPRPYRWCPKRPRQSSARSCRTALCTASWTMANPSRSWDGAARLLRATWPCPTW
ncbi:hypothetical protein C2L71_09995 [Enteroscipio rubneri]|uniref:Uncharacterized protein n=1 Tax=Enteroscipio rubneri TaxID=2070686 RepID=A0A2K2U9I2_9ACTN|nr:hypothetical protein C2L71_09995 [Enteroscipio rubneri]